MLPAAQFLRSSTACVHFVDADEASALASHGDVTVTSIDACSIDGGLLTALAAALQFPEYFGENWDAAEECLAGLPADRAQVVCIRDARSLWFEAPRDCALLIETWLSVVESRGREAAGFHLVFVW